MYAFGVQREAGGGGPEGSQRVQRGTGVDPEGADMCICVTHLCGPFLYVTPLCGLSVRVRLL